MIYSTILAERWSKEEILRYYTEYDIYAKYLGFNFKINKPFNSPFREDKTPSFSIYTNRSNGKLMYKDFATGEGGDVFKFVYKKLGLIEPRDTTFAIARDFALNKSYTPPPRPRAVPSMGSTLEITVTRKNFTKADLEFWGKFGIQEETLKNYNVSALKAFQINTVNQDVAKPDNPIYGFKVFNHFKIYRPLAEKELKWRNSLCVFDIQGFEQLNGSGDILFITKSLKDVMVLREFGYDAVAPPCETSTIPEIVINNLKSRFKRIVVFYDNDAAGRAGAQKLEAYGFETIFLDKSEPKDISDYYKSRDPETAYQDTLRRLCELLGLG